MTVATGAAEDMGEEDTPDLFEELFDPLNRSLVEHGLPRVNEVIAMINALVAEDGRFARAPLALLLAAAQIAQLELEGKI